MTTVSTQFVFERKIHPVPRRPRPVFILCPIVNDVFTAFLEFYTTCFTDQVFERKVLIASLRFSLSRVSFKVSSGSKNTPTQ